MKIIKLTISKVYEEPLPLENQAEENYHQERSSQGSVLSLFYHSHNWWKRLKIIHSTKKWRLGLKATDQKRIILPRSQALLQANSRGSISAYRSENADLCQTLTGKSNTREIESSDTIISVKQRFRTRKELPLRPTETDHWETVERQHEAPAASDIHKTHGTTDLLKIAGTTLTPVDISNKSTTLHRRHWSNQGLQKIKDKSTLWK